jgi:RNA polymerase sigma-70 factor (ECF subfamily)
MLFGAPRMADVGIDPQGLIGTTPPRVELRAYRGEWVLLHWYAHESGDAVRAVTRVDADGDAIVHLKNYFYNPELIAEVCGELELPFRLNGHHWRPACR